MTQTEMCASALFSFYFILFYFILFYFVLFYYFILFYFILLFYFHLFKAVPTAHGGSQARGGIRAVAAGLRHSHSNSRFQAASAAYTTGHSKRQILNPLSEARDQGLNLHPPGYQSYLFPLSHKQNSFIPVFYKSFECCVMQKKMLNHYLCT